MAGLDPCIAVRRICHHCGIIWAASESERTSGGEGTYACGDPHRLGIRPAWIAEAGMTSLLIRLRPQRFGDRLIRHGSQTFGAGGYLEIEVGEPGDPTWQPNSLVWPSGFTPARRNDAAHWPRPESLPESHHAAR